MAIDSVKIDFRTHACLDSKIIYPSTIFLGLNDAFPIAISVVYSDSIVRNLHDADALFFNFSLGSGSRGGNHFIDLDTLISEALEVVKQNITSNKVSLLTKGKNNNHLCKMGTNTNNAG